MQKRALTNAKIQEQELSDGNRTEPTTAGESLN